MIGYRTLFCGLRARKGFRSAVDQVVIVSLSLIYLYNEYCMASGEVRRDNTADGDVFPREMT